MDVRAEPAAVLWIQPKDLPQSPDTDVLQVTVGQRLHVCIGLDHLVVVREVSPNEVSFACGDGRIRIEGLQRGATQLKDAE